MPKAKKPKARAVPEPAPADPLAAALAALRQALPPGVIERPLPASALTPMLAETADGPFTRAGWVFELKIDGHRCLATRTGDTAELRSRNGHLTNDTYPEIVAGLRTLPITHCVLDGELAVLDEQGRPSFQRLQRRALGTRPLDRAQAVRDLPVVLLVFDLLSADGLDLRALPLLERKRLLRLIVPLDATGPIRFVDHLDTDGAGLFTRVQAAGLEGMMGKRADSPYVSGRSRHWMKVRIDRTADFAVVGFTRGEGGRAALGALHLAVREGARWIYRGSVGSGLRDSELDALRARLLPAVAHAVCEGPVPKSASHTWVAPRLVCEVRYKERTEEGLLRHPVFLRLREDKRPDECVESGSPSPSPSPSPSLSPSPSPSPSPSLSRSPAPSPSPSLPPSPSPSRVRFTNLTKPLWPGEGITKGDLIAYYRAVAPVLLPYLRGRAVTLTRYPDGIDGKSFFQKNAPDHTPEWVRVATADVERGEGHHAAVICDDLDTLLWVANLASIPLHLPAARVATPDHPDWCVIDLDPKGAPFAHVIRCALEVRARCDALGLPVFPKTSGQSGLHLIIPLGGEASQAECKALGELLARLVEQRLSDIATTARPIDQRMGKVYLDFLQNGRGKTIAGPYSARPVPGAGVSTPLDWDEVNEHLDPRAFTLRTVPARLERLGRDPLAPVLLLKPDLLGALDRLARSIR